MRRISLWAIITLIMAIESVTGQDHFGRLVITPAPADSTTFLYTNKTTAFYYGEARRINSTAMQGLNVMTRAYFADYFLEFDGHPLDRRTAEVFIYPDHLKRCFSPPQICEEVYLLDSLNVLAVKVITQAPGLLDFIPTFPGSRRAGDFTLLWQEDADILYLDQRQLATDTVKNVLSYPPVTAVLGRSRSSFGAMTKANQARFIAFSAEEQRARSRQFVAPVYLPGRLQINLQDSAFFSVIVGHHQAEVASVQNNLFENFSRSWRVSRHERRDRLQDLYARSAIHSNLAELDKAAAWANFSLDALIMHPQDRCFSREQQERWGVPKVGIFAGLPWFNNFWGRDTFISLPGATLVPGKFAEAREILLSFARFQRRDSTDRRDGRIPNRIMPGEIIYNTADGTGWFVRAARDYVNYSGDTSFVREIFPVVEYAIEAALRHASSEVINQVTPSGRVDSLGFLTHEDAETWMDAVGPQGPWTPRGNRAVEIQALWFEQLHAGIQLGEIAGQTQKTHNWKSAAEKLHKNFLRFYHAPSRAGLYDHLNRDGTPDEQLRPNQIFSLTVPSQPLVSASLAAQILRNVVTKLTYPYGVASLSQEDNQFHPYHHHEPFYVQDAAYHNGTVWTWLSGPVITALVRSGYENLAFTLIEDAVQQILHRGTLGTQSELLDAIAHEGEAYPRLSGTASQAWNLAEFLRNLYQDFFGARPHTLSRSFTLEPALPDKITEVSFRVAGGSATINVHYLREDSLLTVEMAQSDGDQALNFEVINRRAGITWYGRMPKNRSVTLVLSPSGRNDKIRGATAGRKEWKNWWQEVRKNLVGQKMAFATPYLRSDLPALKGPPYPLLTAEEMLMPWPFEDSKPHTPRTSDADELVLSATDSLGDDKGPNGRYEYPRDPVFEAGIFDLEKLEIAEAAAHLFFRLRFRHLTQPGWHPEYGFQLTYCAIALDLDDNSATGGQQLGMNANYPTAPEIGFERVIYVGGGFRVADEKDSVLAEFLPLGQGAEGRKLGDIEKGEIAFAVPRRFIGALGRKWKVGIYCGAQDDHGGAGIGEFRTVARHAGQWVGGGGDRENGNPNVYDVLIARHPEARQ